MTKKQSESATIPEQVKALGQLADLKVNMSRAYRDMLQYRSLLEKIVQPASLLSEKECEIVLSAKFKETLVAIATSSSKIIAWYNKNDNLATSTLELFEIPPAQDGDK